MSIEISLTQPAAGGADIFIETGKQLAEHRDAIEALHADAQIGECVEAALAGAVSTEKTSTVGVGIIKLIIARKDQTYRAREALLAAPDDCACEEAVWIEVKGNTTLRHLLTKYGADLLAYDAARTQMNIEVFTFEVFETSTRSVRVLVRRPKAAA